MAKGKKAKGKNLEMQLIKINLNSRTLENILGPMVEDDLLRYGESWAKQLDGVQDVEGGWKAKIHDRPSRTTVAVYTDDETERFREAVNGDIRKYVNQKTTKGNIKLRKTSKGYEPR